LANKPWQTTNELDPTMRKSITLPLVFGATLAAALFAASIAIAGDEAAVVDGIHQSATSAERIPAYRARFGRTRPVIAVIGENGGTELTDFVIPYGILAQSGVADAVSVGIRPGVLTMRPALHIQPDATATKFDGQYPDGADYVIVPAMVKRNDRAMLAWISAQAAKGATIVSICDGALVVANTGLLNGHRATAHWATLDYRQKTFPKVRWIENARYVADGDVVSSAGISAAIPTSLALVEAIAGPAKALEVGKRLGTIEWTSAHNSEVFKPKLGRNITAYATNYALNGLREQEKIGIEVEPGVDEIALALTADAYTRTARGKAVSISKTQGEIITGHGLKIVPDALTGSKVDRMVTLPAEGTGPIFDTVLASVARDYGRTTAFGVALDFEYPGFHD
jgi:putative intracellular protease/amidase